MILISEFGNEIVMTEDEHKIERLKSFGFTEKKQQPKPVKAKKGATNGDKKETK